jgi:hypothetical protein
VSLPKALMFKDLRCIYRNALAAFLGSTGTP